MYTEQSSLLGERVAQPVKGFDRFSPSQKALIVLLVSINGVLPLFISWSLTPSIPQIAADLHTTGSAVGLAISVFLFASCFATLFWAKYSTFYGRRIVYLCGLPLSAIGSFGVACSTSVTQLLCWRILQAFGISGGISVGGGVIGDIYKLEDRGTIIGIYMAAYLLGPALAPPAGGFIAIYGSWRLMQFYLAAATFFLFLIVVAFFPETKEPGTLGIDQYNTHQDKPRRFVMMNPLGSLGLLRSPNLTAGTVSTTAVLQSQFVLLIPLAYTLGPRYNLNTQLAIGLCSLPIGFGNVFGAPLAGYLSDKIVSSRKAKRNGTIVPEDRLRCAMYGSAIVVPLATILFGGVVEFIPGTLGLVICVICLFINGIGVNLVLTPVAAYGVDIMHHKSAETLAVIAGVRNLLLAFIVAGATPSIQVLGTFYTYIISALVTWFGAIIVGCTIRYGDDMRASVDMGYTT